MSLGSIFNPESLNSLSSTFLTTLGVNKDSCENAGVTAAVESEDDEECKTTGVTDCGIIKSAKMKAMLNAAIIMYNTLNSLRMAKLQRDLGEKYVQLAEDHRRYYNERYKPLEIDLTREAMELPVYVRDKEQLNTGQMLVSARIQTAGVIDKAISCTGRYCTGQRAAILTDQLMQQAVAESMVAGLAHRYTDREEITHNNLRWDKREQVLKVGRDIPTEAVSYATLAAGTFGSLGKQAGIAAEGAMGFLGYGERGNTHYPPRRQPVEAGKYTYTPPKSSELPQPTPRPTYKKPETKENPKLAG